MSAVEELAACCVMPAFPGLEPPGWVRRRLADGLGAVCLFAWNVEDGEQVAALTSALRAERPEVLVGIDEEGGDVTRLEWRRGSSYPGNLALGAVDDEALTEAVARAIGGSLARAGVDLDFAPVADVNSNPRNPVIGVRSFGSEPELVARHVAAFVRGLQSTGVAACAKHFPGHGDTEADSHLELPVARPCLEPFRAAIEAGARAVMTGHLLVRELDDVPATVSRRIVTGLLREELGFAGVVVSDALEMRALSGALGVGEAAVRSLEAGVDLLCLGHDLGDEAVGEAIAALAAAVPEERLAEAAARVEALAAWTAPAAEGAPGPEVGHEAARRAVAGTARVSSPTVIECAPPDNIAAGGLEHGLLPDAPRVRLREGDALPALQGDVVLVLRDAARHPWQRELAERLPNAVLVETGVPGGPADVVTYGAGRVNLEVAAERLGFG